MGPRVRFEIKGSVDALEYGGTVLEYRGLRVSEANPLWLAHRPLGQPKSRISGTFVVRVRLTFFHHEFSSQDWQFRWLHTRSSPPVLTRPEIGRPYFGLEHVES